MNLFENLRLALDSLRANKARSLLTMLGIIIGIASVIGIVTIGDAMTHSVSNSLSSLGSRNIYLFVSPKNDDLNHFTPSERDLISDEMIEDLETHFANEIDGIGVSKAVGNGKARFASHTSNVSITGVNESAESTDNITLLTGRFLQSKDVLSERNVAIVSDLLVKNLFHGDVQQALGQEIQVTGDQGISTFIIVGVYEFKEDPMMGTVQTGKESEKRTTLYTPITTASNMMQKDPKGYQQIIVKAKSSVDLDHLSDELNAFMNRYYASNQVAEIQTQSVENITNQADEMMSSIKLAIAIIAGISLLVGGIGVMNIMLVSVTERTREIGIRKALGATNNNIRFQFIVESMIVCLIGGIIGILLGGFLGYIGGMLIDSPTPPSLISIIVAVTFSMGIGVFFGFYPANKAAQLDPIDALRYE